MIEITFNPKDFDLTVEGHAEGADTVCASVSVLTYTLGSALESLGKNCKMDFTIKEGNGHIKCKAKKGYKGNVALMYHTILCGYEGLSKSYPEHVKFVVVGGQEN